MKSPKGVTLISLTVYIIVMVIVVAVVSVISGFFYKNTDGLTATVDPIVEYTKFNTFFSQEVNHENIKVLECETEYETPVDSTSNVTNSYIVFDDEVQYTFIKANTSIYRNKVKICDGVDSCKFEYKIKNGKAVVVVTFKVGDKTKETEFTLKM